MANNFEDPGQDKPYSALLGGLFNTALDVGKQYLPKPKANTAPTPPPAIPQANVPTGQPAWLKPVLIVAGVVVALVFGAVMLSGRGTK